MLLLTEPSWYDKDGKLQNISDFVHHILDLVHPVGSIYMTMNSQNPSTLFGGEWVAWGEGRVPVGAGTGRDINGVSKTFVNGATGGEYNHTLSNEEMPKHNHTGVWTEVDSSIVTGEGGGMVSTRMVSTNNNIYTAVAEANKNYFTNFKTANAINQDLSVDDSDPEGEKFMSGNQGSGRAVTVKIEGGVPENGNDRPHNNIQPYITCYMWKRTA